MAGPWERYQAAPPPAEDASGPWARYQSAPPKEERRGEKVYDQPVGPEQASAVDRVVERVKDPKRWEAILAGTGPYAAKVVQGDAPLAMPSGAVPRLAKAATALAEGQGLGYAAGRTALSAGQGAVMSALDGKEGESWQDKLDRAKSGAKLSGGIQLAAESLPYIGKAAGAVARKLGSAGSGIDESLIGNYAARTDEVNDLIKKSGGDMTEAADLIRGEISAGIQRTKAGLNAQITKVLEQSAPDVRVSAAPILEKLEAAKARLNPNFKAGAISDLDDMIQAIRSEAADGSLSVSSLYQVKQFLQENAKGAYQKGGQIFSRASEASRAAREAASDVREMLKPVAPAISKADAQLSKLHAIESRLNKNLLAPGKPDGALFAAGSGANPRNAATLRELERISGVPASQRALDAATARAFAKPAILPTDYTGKAVARQAGAAILGTAIGGPVGGAVGGALASPMAVKLGVNAMNVGRTVAGRLPPVAQAIRQNPVTATAATQLAAGQIRRANEKPAPGEAPRLMRNTGPGVERKPADRPRGGPDRWASDGLDKLGIRDEATRSRLLQSKEGKRLLIEASDLEPGNPRMKRIRDQIQKGWGSK